MRLGERIKDLERKGSVRLCGLVVVLDGETVQDAIRRKGIAASNCSLVLIPAKKEYHHGAD